MATFAQIMFGQSTAVLGGFQLIASGFGLLSLAVLLWTYFQTRDASFWKSETVKSVYWLAMVISLAPLKIEAFTAAFGPIAGVIATIMEIALVIAGMVVIYPVTVSGAVVYTIEFIDDMLTYFKEGTLGTKYPKWD